MYTKEEMIADLEEIRKLPEYQYLIENLGLIDESEPPETIPSSVCEFADEAKPCINISLCKIDTNEHWTIFQIEYSADFSTEKQYDTPIYYSLNDNIMLNWMPNVRSIESWQRALQFLIKRIV